eukprot:jgi/Mesen1/7581/ME000392S06842
MSCTLSYQSLFLHVSPAIIKIPVDTQTSRTRFAAVLRRGIPESGTEVSSLMVLSPCTRNIKRKRLFITQALSGTFGVHQDNNAYAGSENVGVLPAQAGEFPPLLLGGSYLIDPPVVLAPMAGVTNAVYRRMCRQQGAGLCVSEMVAAHLLVKGSEATEKLASFESTERPRSIQLYGTDCASLSEATRMLVGEGRVEHIDLNFGCPVRKVVTKGGGAAVAANPSHLAALVRAVVSAAGPHVPVTVKMRLGLTAGNHTYMSAGLAAQDEGAAWVALHARTAEQLYDPPAHWDAIARLASSLTIPVLGNGDVLECWDALRLMRLTGAAGVLCSNV